jgi:hypothetical protein
LQHAYLAEKFAFLSAFLSAFLAAFDLTFFKRCLDSSVLVEFPFQPCIIMSALVWR